MLMIKKIYSNSASSAIEELYKSLSPSLCDCHYNSKCAFLHTNQAANF